jgi:hypothetical protein
MSHSVQTTRSTEFRFVLLTIINYALGGEAVTAADAGIDVTAVDGLILGQVPAGQNSLGVPLFPLFTGGKIMLFRFTAGAPVEIAATNGLNAVVPGIAHVSGL